MPNATTFRKNQDLRVAHSAEDFVEANGIQLCWDSFGDSTHPALILIMGMGAQMVGWDDEFCTQLALRGFRVIRFDNRDVGRSTWLHDAGIPDVTRAMMRAWMRWPVTAPYVLADMARDVIGLMDALGIERAHIVGASMGGTIAQVMSIQHPERMLSMTSIMSTTGDPDLPKPHPTATTAVMRPMPSKLEDYVERYVDTYRVLRLGQFPEEEERDRIRAARNHGRGVNSAGGARHLVAILASGSRKNALKEVGVPTLVIHGNLDPLVPLAAGLETAQCIPDAEMMIVEGMGHTLPKALWPQLTARIAGVAERAA
ncbi:MAG: alpha/beta hydrolase [Comamonadaceae bacterium]|nr:alpha/beta hydrolase [Comamonadaceae bacterium]